MLLLGSFARYLSGRKVRPAQRTIAARVRLSVETLEGRCVPATLDVFSGGSIQSAIDLAHAGDIVRVHPGTYTEQLTIAKSIVVKASADSNLGETGNSAIILAPATLGVPTPVDAGAMVHITGNSVRAEIAGFVIRGDSSTNGVQNLLYGVRVDGNAFATIDHNKITNVISLTNGSAGVAVSVGNSANSADGFGAQVGSAVIVSNTIVNYQRAGIIVSNTGSSATIISNTITGIAVHPSDSITGVEISKGAIAKVFSNSIRNNTNPANPVQNGTGVFFFAPGQGTEVEQNSISGNDYGAFGSSVIGVGFNEGQGVSFEFNRVTNNTFVGAEFDNSRGVDLSYNSFIHNGSADFEDGGIFLFNSKGFLIVSNSSLNNIGNGIFIDATSTGNHIQANNFTGNRRFGSIAGGDVSADAVDLTIGGGKAGTNNNWINNISGTSATVSGGKLLRVKTRWGWQ
jgi:Right handed beta helix region